MLVNEFYILVKADFLANRKSAYNRVRRKNVNTCAFEEDVKTPYRKGKLHRYCCQVGPQLCKLHNLFKKPRERKKTEMQPGLSDRNHAYQ